MTNHANDPNQVPDQDFWAKVGGQFQKIGRGVLFNALTLFFTMKDPATPLWVKGMIAGALAYLINPVDAIPDVVPVAGYTDDAGVLAGTMGAVMAWITDHHRNQANAVLDDWFG